jgi:hypothetical protein
MAKDDDQRARDLPHDNGVRLAVCDALSDENEATRTSTITDDELFARVIGRLRVLVPRELHLVGERAYFDEKLRVCADAGLVDERFEHERKFVTLAGRLPQIRYPDGEIRDYSPGLELARERLDRDNFRLRTAGFDVHNFVPTIADEPNGRPFRALLDSMREHGFMKQFPLVKYEDGVVIDGRARLRAADMLDLHVEYLKYGSSEKERMAARRRDTPLNRILVALHSNAARLRPEEIDNVHEQVAAVTHRSWNETAADLALTAEWRRSIPSEYSYSPVFEVKRLPYRAGDQAKIQVTSDNKVMLRSLVEAGGLSNYKIDYLRQYVPFERARSTHSAGRKAVFARAEDLITGIAAMQQERRAMNLKVDPEWEDIREWLISTFEPQPS